MRKTTAFIGGTAIAALFMAATPGAVLAQDDAAPQDRASRATDRFMGLLDIDDDGRVTLEEIAAEQGRLFAAIDVDGDGNLSVDEFRRRGLLLQSIGATTLFDMLDANGDAQLTTAELRAPSERWVRRYDTDGDTALGTDEVRTARQGRFGRGRGDGHR